MLTETACVNLPRSIVTDHHSLGSMLIISPEILEEGTLDPANDTKLGVHILPLAFPWTLAMIRKVATILGPAALASLIRMAQLVYDGRIKPQASSSKRLTAGSG